MTPRKSEGRRGKKRSGLALASETRGRGRGGGRERRIIENIFQRVLIRTCAAFDPRFCTFLPLDTLQLAVATRKKPMIQDQGEEEGGGRGGGRNGWGARVDRRRTWRRRWGRRKKKKHGRSVTIEEHRNPLEEIISRG